MRVSLKTNSEIKKIVEDIVHSYFEHAKKNYETDIFFLAKVTKSPFNNMVEIKLAENILNDSNISITKRIEKRKLELTHSSFSKLFIREAIFILFEESESEEKMMLREEAMELFPDL